MREGVANGARSALAAIAFLTRVPVRARMEAADAGRAVIVFPLVGAVVGAIVAGVAVGLSRLGLPASVSAAAGVGIGTAITGALHVDGLADSVDALGARDQGTALRVMRDPSIGAFGATAICLDLMLKTASISALMERHVVVGASIAASALARSVPLLAATRLIPARESGLGAIIAHELRPWRTWAAVVLGGAFALAAGGPAMVAQISVVGVVTILWALLCRSRFGGVTGDTIGANIEMVETAALVAALSIR